jgi:hypothetical protein
MASSRARSRYSFRRRFVMSPGLPSPILAPSTEITGITQALAAV